MHEWIKQIFKIIFQIYKIILLCLIISLSRIFLQIIVDQLLTWMIFCTFTRSCRVGWLVNKVNQWLVLWTISTFLLISNENKHFIRNKILYSCIYYKSWHIENCCFNLLLGTIVKIAKLHTYTESFRDALRSVVLFSCFFRLICFVNFRKCGKNVWKLYLVNLLQFWI